VSETLELSEIQGLILSGYGERPVASYVLFEITHPERARRWLLALTNELQFGEFRASSRGRPPFLKPLCANVAFTYEGFAVLGLPSTALSGFSLAFQEGMAEPSRARRLGDDGESAPEHWLWGGPGRPLHGIMMVYAGSEAADPKEWHAVRDFVRRHTGEAHGVHVFLSLDATALDQTERKEHFGFRDGIANPGILGLSRRTSGDMVKPGEIVLGYENGYDCVPLSPEVPAELDPQQILPRGDGETRRDFGRNGSYLVFRQLLQRVQEFWQYVASARASIPDAPAGAAGNAWLAAKLVGRWPNGTALTLYPDAPGPDSSGDNDEFDFGHFGDAYGKRCPLGSHVRRSNPRDTALPVPHDPELSGTPEDAEIRKRRLALVDLHRLMRRGRMYGPPLDVGFDPEVLRTAPHDGVERGLHFLCFNANLNRQFEFVQSNWVNNPCFAGLSRDPDPLLSARRERPFSADEFVIQGLPPRRIRGLPRVVEVRGGAYLFMPSKAALRYLATLSPQPALTPLE
jgi:Dyp-type peroxidase family